MFTIIYKETQEPIETKEAIIQWLNHKNQEKPDKQFVMIEKENGDSMDFAIGLDQETIIFYVPQAEEEAIKITCNESVNRSKGTVIILDHPVEETVELSNSNTISFEEGIEILSLFLDNQAFIQLADWYSY